MNLQGTGRAIDNRQKFTKREFIIRVLLIAMWRSGKWILEVFSNHLGSRRLLGSLSHSSKAAPEANNFFKELKGNTRKEIAIFFVESEEELFNEGVKLPTATTFKLEGESVRVGDGPSLKKTSGLSITVEEYLLSKYFKPITAEEDLLSITTERRTIVSPADTTAKQPYSTEEGIISKRMKGMDVWGGIKTSTTDGSVDHSSSISVSFGEGSSDQGCSEVKSQGDNSSH